MHAQRKTKTVVSAKDVLPTRLFPASFWRPRPGTPAFIAMAALLNVVLYHAPLYEFAAERLDIHGFGGVLTLSMLFVLVWFVTALLLGLASFISQSLLRPLCMLGAMFNAIALYFIQSYGVLLDKTMMGNIANTDWAEATALWHPKLLMYVAVFGLLPCLLIAWVKPRPVRRLRLGAFAAMLTIAGVGWAYAVSSTWLWIDKYASPVGSMILPWSYTFNLARYRMALWAATRQANPLPDASFGSDEKTVVVLVIGESARAQNYELYGYPRPTNPVLSAAGAVALADTQACATYTTQALQCILSPDDPGLRLAGASELLPSYLQRQGIDVIWRSNNSGEPPLKVATYERAKALSAECGGAKSCTHDELLLYGLEQRIRASPHRKVFVTLHLSGSHGPSYATKYPPSFEVFRPVCQSVELSQCTPESLLNAYDNTILYNDHVVGRAISLLKGLGDVSSTLLYISDHGESLGEYGLFLHGTPLSIAPDVQTKIPFVVWASSAFKRFHLIDDTVLARGKSHSQANIFHSVMGAFDMRSRIYKPGLDIYSTAPGSNGPR
jgi:lipid A ethanolaminephosphotransferase